MSFKDGGLISIKDPNIEITVLTADRTHNMVGTLTITDHINKLEAIVTYNPKPEGSSSVFKSFKNKFMKSGQQQPTDYFTIQIF